MSRWHVTPEICEEAWWDTTRYQSLLKADGRHWAWAWLRRSHRYQDAAARTVVATLIPVGSGGFCLKTPNLDRLYAAGIFVHPARGGHPDVDARLFWRADLDPSIVRVTAERIAKSHPDAFDIARFPDMADLVMDKRGREMLLLADGPHQIQLQVGEGTLANGPVRLRYQFGGFENVDAKLKTVARLASLRRLGRFASGLFPPEPGAAKWIRALQAYDGLAAGASQKDIAGAIFGDKLVQEEWKGRSDFLRLRIQRLINFARDMVDGGYKRHLQ